MWMCLPKFGHAKTNFDHEDVKLWLKADEIDAFAPLLRQFATARAKKTLEGSGIKPNLKDKRPRLDWPKASPAPI